MPTLEDERKTYQSWGWSWTPDKEPTAVTEPINNYYITDPGIHDVTEGDDLWTYTMMYQRTGNGVYLGRATAWARYFKDEYRTACSGYYYNFCHDKDTYGGDHMYGWGLLSWYEYTCAVGACDVAALVEAENIGTEVEQLWAPSSPYGCLRASGCTEYGLRGVGRHLLLITRLAEVTNDARWISLRDRILDTTLAASHWNSTVGMYFIGDWSTDYVLGAGAYASGIRIQSPFQLGVLAEAFYRAYLATGRNDLRTRLTMMAEFVYQNGIDATYQYAGTWFGLKNGLPFHSNNSSQSTIRNCNTSWDPAYTTSLVNTLVLGYKLTGDGKYYNRAREFFNRGTKGVYGTACDRAAADNVVHHFVDTVFDSASGYYMLSYNKGELQYTYLVFENGGNPYVIP